VLRCTADDCQREYPVIDGLPLLIAPLREYLSSNLHHVWGRDDLGPLLESIIGDCCGPGSPFDVTRQHLSSYSEIHYADRDPERAGAESQQLSLRRLLDECLPLVGGAPEGPAIDLGCSVGGGTFHLAESTGRQVLGVDLNYSMMRMAAAVLRSGVVSYPRRRVGLVYERREFATSLPAAEQVDFWGCDATGLPFEPESFSLAVGMNVLDSVKSPVEFIQSVASVLKPGGKLLLACPYDWSPAATAIESWLGGHSQRGAGGGRPEPVLRSLLTPGAHPLAAAGMQIIAERDDLTWRVPMYDRSTVHYRLHVIAAEKAS